MGLPPSLALVLLGCVLGVGWAPSALAEPAPETEPAAAEVVPAQTLIEKTREVFASGVRAYEERRYKDAIDLFQEANRITANPAFSFNIGIAYEDMGDSAMALRHYREYMRQVPDAPDRDAVDQRIERIEEILAIKGIQQVSILSEPAGARLSIDAQPVGVTPWTGELVPGHHVLTLEIAGYRDEARDFDLPPKRSIDVPVTLRAKDASDEAPVPVEPSTTGSGRVLDPIRPETWAVFGVGLASLGTSVGFELSRVAILSDARREPIQVSSEQLLDKARDQQMWGRGFLMMGTALAVTGVVLAYFNLQAPDPVVTAGCGRTGCGAVISGRF
jgi:tetratricopeptide (TPR) repeat protein